MGCSKASGGGGGGGASPKAPSTYSSGGNSYSSGGGNAGGNRGSGGSGGAGGGGSSASSPSGRDGAFRKAALDKKREQRTIGTKQVTRTTGIAEDKNQVRQHGYRSRFESLEVKDRRSGQTLGKTSTVTDPSGKVVREKHGGSGTNRSFWAGLFGGKKS